MPDVKCIESDTVTIDITSVAMLRDRSPWLLDRFVPAAVQGDGNCRFRAVSLALYGDETYHSLLRLLASIESLLNASFYDHTSSEYYEPFKVDACLVVSECDMVRNGAYSDMLTVLAVSSVIQKPIQTRWLTWELLKLL